MKVEVTENLVLTQEEYDILVKANKLVGRIYNDTEGGSGLESITNVLVNTLDDLLNYEYLKVE